MFKKFPLVLFVFMYIMQVSAQQVKTSVIDDQCNEQIVNSPLADYYASAYKKWGPALKTVLHDLTKGHTQVSYSSLYTYYVQTDSKPNGKVWDMYSDKPNGTPAYEYTHGVKQCGNYSGEGDCYNREHTWPQSWFNSASIPSSDLFNVYPTDGYVNNRRGNYTYGEVGSSTWTSTNGSKVGGNTAPGNSSTVFEPIDAYKGDLARSHFYVSVRYYTEDGSWATSPGTNKSELLQWYANMLYKWSMKDSVSTKEINRNEAVYIIQKKRNPFIDHPEFVAEIWMTTMAPQVVSLQCQNRNTLIIDFSRYLDSALAVDPSNFILSNGAGSPLSVTWGINNDISKLQLSTAQLAGGTTYTLQIKNLKSINSVAMNDTTISFTTDGTVDVTENKPEIPSTLQLDQNYPNPFNPSTRINFNIPADGNVTLKVYDALGKEAAVLVDGFMLKGSHNVRWDASSLTSGLYIYRLTSEGNSVSKKLLLMK